MYATEMVILKGVFIVLTHNMGVFVFKVDDRQYPLRLQFVYNYFESCETLRHAPWSHIASYTCKTTGRHTGMRPFRTAMLDEVCRQAWDIQLWGLHAGRVSLSYTCIVRAHLFDTCTYLCVCVCACLRVTLQVLDNFVLDGSGSVESVELSDVKLSDVSAPDSTSSPPLSSEF